MTRIGLIGEHPNDTGAMQVLLNRIYPGKFDFFPMLKRIHGSELDSKAVKRFLRIEYQTLRPDWIIFIRDLDGFEEDKKQLNDRKRYFAEFRSVVGHSINRKRENRNAFYLLHIWQIEALILSDIATVNMFYQVALESFGDPMLVQIPKNELKKVSNYKESHCSELFKRLDLDKVKEVRYFKRFLNDFERTFKSIA